MVSLSFAATAAVLFASLAESNPINLDKILDIIESPPVLGGSTFKIPQILNTGFSASGPAALAKAFAKYNTSLTSDLSGALSLLATTSGATKGDDTVAATPLSFDSQFLCPVQIGTPPQTLNLDFDTGSSDLWVFSTETPESQVDGQTLYNPFISSSARNLTLADGATWSIGYADGSGSSGDVLYDVVSVGDVTVQQQAVESARQVSSQFTSTSQSSGLLGLAFDSINKVTPKQSTFFSNAISSLASPLFTVNLLHNSAGNYNFGFIDNTEHTGSITYVPVDKSGGFWGFTMSGFAVGSGSIQSNEINAIADTGTTLLLLPDNVVTAYYGQVKGATYDKTASGYIFPCSAKLPDFTFKTGAYTGVVPGSYMNYAPASQANMCYGGLQSSAGVGFSIFGDIAMKAQFLVFDAGNSRLGWAPKNLN